jgi:hypothetical protein
MKLPSLIGEESAELLDLAALVEGVVAERARTLPAELQLVVDVASNLARIHGVRSELERLVGALLELWLASAAESGGVALVVDHTEDGHGVRLEVLNTSPAAPDHTTSPRLDRGDALRVVLGVVGRHDATLRVATHTHGSTRLEIVFPLARATDRVARCRRPTQPLPRQRPIH